MFALVMSSCLEEKEEPFCFLLTAPLIITYKSKEEELELSFTLWSPFSKSVEYRIPFDYVISMGEPKDDILEKYLEIAGPLFDKLEQINEEENLSIDEEDL